MRCILHLAAMPAAFELVDLAEDYKGQLDQNQRPHGRGSLQVDVGCCYHGQFVHGCRQGRGTLTFSSSGDQDNHEEQEVHCWIAGRWQDDVLHGSAVVTAADGSTTAGSYVHGSLEGHVTEFYPGDAACASPPR